MKNVLLLSAFLVCATISFGQPPCGDLKVNNYTPTGITVQGQTGSSCAVIGNYGGNIGAGNSATYTGTTGNAWMYLRIVGDGTYPSPTPCSSFTCGGTGTAYTVTWGSCCEVTVTP